MSKMIVYKFGGASIKDSAALKNLSEILRNRLCGNMVVVVSAMGKMTNALEEILKLKLEGADFSSNSASIRLFHLQICEDLFPENHPVYPQLENLFISLEKKLERNLTKENYDEFYDLIVGYGELISSRIVMEFLCLKGLTVIWKDAREFVKTDSNFRFAQIDWTKTRYNCHSQLKPILGSFPILTQGFIGSDSQGRPTTLGREGSDFTAAILASSLDASAVTIWKDVPGVLNADPKRFEQTVLLKELGYQEAAEMTYYGASVIHPKTIKPLANAKIPLFVKSFLDPEKEGTKIYLKESSINLPVFIIKENQLLVSFKVTDFTFISEEHIHRVYEELKSLKLRVNLLQVSAISISLVLDSQFFKLEKLLNSLKPIFEIRYNEGLELLTILHPANEEKENHLKGYQILLEQSTRNTLQIVRRKID